MWYVVHSDELYHHGIKGQKWGVRRFQNPDGTLTAAGRKRIGDKKADDYEIALKMAKQYDIDRAKQKASKKASVQARKEAKRQKKSDVRNRRTLSDKELREKIQRLQLEKQMKDLSNQDLHAGRMEVDRIMKQIGTKVISTVVAGALLYGAKYAVEKKGNPQASVDYQQLANAVFNGGPKKKGN